MSKHEEEITAYQEALFLTGRDLAQALEQLTEVQKRCTELAEEVRRLKQGA